MNEKNMKKYLLGLVITAAATSSHAAVEETVYRGMGEASAQFPSFKKMQKQGLINKKPDISRNDYNDVYKLKKPLQFMGQTVALLSDEYMTQYAGCCVSEGWGAVLAKKSDMKLLTQFAKTNQCSLSKVESDASNYYGFKLKALPTAEYYELSCRERDLENQQ